MIRALIHAAVVASVVVMVLALYAFAWVLWLAAHVLRIIGL
jgi:hypothetical protein